MLRRRVSLVGFWGFDLLFITKYSLSQNSLHYIFFLNSLSKFILRILHTNSKRTKQNHDVLYFPT